MSLTNMQSIVESALFKAGESTVDTSGDYYAKALEYANDIVLDMKNGIIPAFPDRVYDFVWAKKYPESTLILRPKYNTGTVDISNDSSSVTFSQSISDSKEGWYLKITNESDVYRIYSHDSGSDTAQLDSVFTGSSSSTAGFDIFKIDYTLGVNDVLRICSPIRIDRNTDTANPYRIEELSVKEFDKNWPVRNISEGIPSYFKRVDDSEETVTIRFNRFPKEDLIRASYDYIDLPGDLLISETPPVPTKYRKVIVHMVAGLILQDKSDNKSQTEFQLASNHSRAMGLSENKNSSSSSTNYARVFPRRRSKRRRYNEEVKYSS